MVTFPVAERRCPLAGTKLYCLVTEAHGCEQLAQSCYSVADVTDTCLVTFFSLRVSYVIGHWSVTGRSAGQELCVAWWPGRTFGLLGHLAGKLFYFLFLGCYFGLCIL